MTQRTKEEQAAFEAGRRDAQSGRGLFFAGRQTPAYLDGARSSKRDLMARAIANRLRSTIEAGNDPNHVCEPGASGMFCGSCGILIGAGTAQGPRCGCAPCATAWSARFTKGGR